MRKKKITVNIDTTYKYVQLWNGIFDLTNKELTILSSFIYVNNITEEVTKEENVSSLDSVAFLSDELTKK